MQAGLTLADLYQNLNQHRAGIANFLGFLPLLGPAIGFAFLKINEKTGAWFLSLLVHVSVLLIVPSIAVFFYQGFILGQNLIEEIDLLTVVGPIASGCVTIFVTHKVLDLDELPGFERIWSLFLLTGLVTGVVWILSRSHFYFGAFMRTSLSQLSVGILVIYLLFKMLLAKTFGTGGERPKKRLASKDTPEPIPPSEVDESYQELQSKIKRERDSGHGDP